jgi:1,4-dihydroxy-2-naphthoate octaprenyltransferase
VDPKTAFLSTRPWSFTMTFSSVTLGTLLAALHGAFSPPLYAVTLAGMVAFHAATNVLNDFYDVRHGVDKVGAPTTKYRLHPAAFGQTPLSSTLLFSVVMYGFTLAAAVYLASTTTPAVLYLVAAGILGSVLYTADPVVLKAKALGEVTVFVMWGLLIPLGAYMVQTSLFSWTPLGAAVPVGVLVALVLLANNIRDINYDGSVRTRTVAVVLGTVRSERVYSGLLALTYLYVGVGVGSGLLPLWSLLVFLTAPEAWGLRAMFRGEVPDDADPRTAALALRFSLLYMVSFVLAIWLPATV